MAESFSSEELFQWIEEGRDYVYLDVRGEEDHARFSIEGPSDIALVNVPYFDFMEDPVGCVEALDPEATYRTVCAKQGSAMFVAEILEEAGFDDVRWLEGGMIGWGQVLIPKRIPTPAGYELWQFNRPGKASCSYGLVHDGQMMVFDASRNIDFYTTFAQAHGLRITHLFETHLQADYVSGGAALAAATGATYLAHDGDFASSNLEYTPVEDGATVRFEGDSGPGVLCTHAPGHTPGSTVYLIDERFMVSGDTVFIVSVGRPDLGKKVVEWAKQLYATLQERICTLPDDLVVLPGHYTDWGAEGTDDRLIMNDFGTIKSLNEAIYGLDNEDDFVAYIVDHMRDQPEVYNTIRQLNAGLITAADEELDTMELGKNECAASHMAA